MGEDYLNLVDTKPSLRVVEGAKWITFMFSVGDFEQWKNIQSLFKQNKGICGATWVPGEIAFKCKTCEKDPTCAICSTCFTNGDHEGHEYSLITTSSGMCDCGDADSWCSEGFCKLHSGPSVDPTQHLPPVLKNNAILIFRAIVDVICEYVTVMNKYASNNEGYKTKDKKYQKNCITILNTIEEYCKQYPCLKRIACQVLAKPLGPEHTQTCALDLLLFRHSRSTPMVREALYSFYSSCLSDMEFKKIFSEYFTKHYKDFVLHN
ncbi:hypothetical protein AKO1_001240, partial [Acrasis kona]